MKDEILKIKKYIKNNYKAILLLFLISIITYSIKIFNYSISIDSEVTINDISANSIPWISTGRWALVVLGKFVHLGLFNPFYSNLLMAVILVLSVITLSYIISSIIDNKKYDKLIMLFIGAIVLTSPIICEMLIFTMMAVEISIGLFLVALSIYFSYLAIYKKHKLFYILAIATLVFSMGIYQAFFPLYISFAAFIFVINSVKEKGKLKESISNIVKFVLVFLVSYIVNVLINKLLLNYYGLHESTYLTSQINWGKISRSDIILIMQEFINGIIFPKYSKLWNYSYLCLIVLSFIFYIKIIIEYKSKSILIILGNVFLMATPFLLVFIMGSNVTDRTMINFPFVVGLLLAFYYYYFDKKVSKILIAVIISLTFVIQLKSTYDILYIDYVRYEDDKQIVNRVFDDIYKIEDYDKKKIVFIGLHQPTSKAVYNVADTAGHSFFEWDYPSPLGINKRVHDFAATLGYNYELCSEDDYKKAVKYGKENDKVYPKKGYIIDKNKYIIIKMS